ncbi:MAG: caspase family protein [Polyangiaceae bacterium]
MSPAPRQNGRSRSQRGLLLLWQCCVVGLVLCCTSLATAEVQRYALVVGNDEGAPGEVRLSYAESDARKVLGVLQSLGDFPPENTVLMLGRGSTEVQRALIALNSRLRAETTGPGGALLFVYYSGHADARALHLGQEELDLMLLQRLVHGSSAGFRLLLVDACRSGALTRVKGARPAQPFEIRLDEQLTGEGVAMLTSSAADEDAQESDELRGSFFTHYFVSGLRGAADRNGNGAISLEEAYDYAYQHTLRASSRTAYGLQHPTFQFDFKGKGGIPLTWVHGVGGPSALLELRPGRTYLLFARDAQGAVVAEVDIADARRTLALEPGRYFVRAREADHLLEGSIELAAGERRALSDAGFERVEYARLTRKGGPERALTHGPYAGYALRSPLSEGAGYCHGVRAGYAVDLPVLTLGASVGACRSTFSNAALSARADELSLEFSLRRVLDLPIVSLGLGVSAGASWLRQSFETVGLAPARDSVAGQLGVLVDASFDLGSGFYLLAEAAGQLYVFEQQTTSAATSTDTRDLTAVFGWRPLLGAGKRF